MKTISEKNSVKNQVINDFGQKIGGAHKDRAREAAERLAGVEASALLLKPLTQVAKLPDLRGLYQSGAISSDVARLAWYYWAQIGTKPGGAYPSRLRRWADNAAALIGEVARILSYGLSEKSQIPELLELENAAQSWELFSEEMTAANWPADEYKRGAYYIGRHWMYAARYCVRTSGRSYYTDYSTAADAVAAIREKVGKNTTKTAQQFSLYKTSAGVYFITPKGKSGIKLAEFSNKEEAYAAYGDTEKLGKLYDDLKKFPAERRDWNRPRLGENWRSGQDMTPESFAGVFPFRGVEFGNWVNQMERAACLNECADALQDFAAVVGIRPEAVTLGGSLAWAFGSRGVGKALAHYEPARRVVNLTKKKGNGCVAHEWFHALDNYLMIQAGKPALFMVSDCLAYGDTDKSPIQEAAYNLKLALLTSGMYTRSKRIDAFRSTPYWSTVTEMAARAFEAVTYYKLEAAGMCNDYLVNITPESEYARSECYPYPTKEEAAELAPLFDAFIMAAFTEAERAPMVEPSAPLLPEVQDEAPAVAASEPMNDPTDDQPQASAEDAQGAAYGDSEESQNPEAYSDALADLIAVHVQTKQKHPEAVVLFRKDDFYMSYFADAHTVAHTLELAESTDSGAPVVAFNAFDLDKFLPKLIRAGLRVCIADHPGYNVPEPPKYKAPTTVERLDGSGEVSYVNCEKSQNPEVQEYCLMYLFGAWVTKETIHAETDEEAIFDADAAFKEAKTLHHWNGVALVQGYRFVKMYRPIREDDHGKLTYYNIETMNGENRKIPVDPMD